MKTDSKDLRVREGGKVDLKKRPTIVGPMYKSKARVPDVICASVR
jgi:hypothetical protein